MLLLQYKIGVPGQVDVQFPINQTATSHSLIVRSANSAG
jgi:hypothetical protein